MDDVDSLTVLLTRQVNCTSLFFIPVVSGWEDKLINFYWLGSYEKYLFENVNLVYKKQD